MKYKNNYYDIFIHKENKPTENYINKELQKDIYIKHLCDKQRENDLEKELKE